MTEGTPASEPSADKSTDTQPPRKRRRWFSRRNLLITAVVLVALYALIGFVGVPIIAQKIIIPKVNDALPGTVAIDKVRCNPFTLRITLERIDFDDEAAGLSADVERVVVDAQWSSIWSAYRLREFTVDKPVIAFKLRPSEDVESETSADPQEASQGEPILPIDLAEIVAMIRDLPRAAVDRMSINDGELIFEDLTREESFEERVSFSFAMNDFDTLAGVDNVSRFEARTDGGGMITAENTLRVDPLMLSGTFEVAEFPLADYDHYAQIAAGNRLEGGVVAVSGSYRVDPLADTPVIEAVVASYELAGLAVRDETIAPSVTHLETVSVGPIRVDVIGSRVEIEQVTTQGLRVLLVRDPQAPIPLPPEGAEPSEAPEDTESAEQPVEPEPETAPEASAPEGATAPVEPMPEEPAAPVEPMPLLVLTGEDGQTTTLIDLASPWTVALARMEHTDHRVALMAALPEPGAEVPEIGPAPGDDTDPEPIVSFERLLVEDVVLLDRPLTASVALVRLEGFVALGKINEDARLNIPFANTVSTGGAASGSGSEEDVDDSRTVEAPPLQRAILEMEFGPITAKVDRVELANGRVDVQDLSQRSPFLFAVTEIEAEVTGVSTDHAVPIVAKVNAKLPGEGTAEISGDVLREEAERRADLAINIAGMSLVPISPYTGRYLGHGVKEDSRFIFISDYQLEGSYLKGTNNLTLDRFYLGEKVESSEAIQLPVKLGLSLLRDGNEQITLAPGVEGDLDDPQFKIGPVVIKAFTDVFTNIISSPFSFIGNQFGGGEMDLSFVVFEPGSSTVTPDAAAKLDVLGKAMAERPQLTLAIAAGADDADRTALRKQKLVDSIRASDQTDTVSDERYRRAIEKLARQVGTGEGAPDALAALKTSGETESQGPRPRGGRRGVGVKRPTENTVSLQELLFGQDKKPTPAEEEGNQAAQPTFAELEAQVLETVALTDEDLATLISARADSVQRYLASQTTVDEARISIVTADPETSARAVAGFELQ